MLKKCKYFLGLLFVGLFLLTNFSSAGSYHHVYDYEGGTVSNSSYFIALNYPSKGIPAELTLNCTITNLDGNVGNNCSKFMYNIYYLNQYFSSAGVGKVTDGTINFYSGYNFTITYDFSNINNYNLFGFINFGVTSCNLTSQSFSFDCTFSGDDVVDTTCPTCQECETCPVIDTNYCVSNDLCPVSSGSWSELVINNIVHEGKPLINLNIPDYIYWDYTGNENQYDIYIGSGYDQDYIDSVLKINSYRPDSEDFTNIFVSGLTLIFPYIFVVLLIVFIWKLLKRVFK